ncbi:unnamed protein product [Cyprideis torosa]|uniref:Uncharacterized protein n=1 Tax=Cyprideis torosa TaxID=163714 RepID=A0A7R8WI94_9CRUS|nr:unnamed protein product [Cyprideis torosa]CAG0894217.1 unnamed protein product [Cyprideis torosa]
MEDQPSHLEDTSPPPKYDDIADPQYLLPMTPSLENLTHLSVSDMKPPHRLSMPRGSIVSFTGSHALPIEIERDLRRLSVVHMEEQYWRSEENKLEAPAEKLRRIKPQIFAALAVSIGSMSVGMTAAYTSPALVSMNSTESRVRPTQEEQTWIGSLMPLCALCGGAIGGTLIEKLGRKHTLLGTSLPFILGKPSSLPFILAWLLIAFAQDVLMIYAGRAIAGLCIGICSLTMPVFLGEIIEPEIRGTLGLLPTTIGNLGILAMYLVGSFADWTQLAMFGATIPCIYMFCMFLVPETPRFYISRGKRQAAFKALKWLRPDGHRLAHELKEIELHMETREKAEKAGLRDFVKPVYVQALLISMGLMFFQQFSGINAVIFYSAQIFRAAGSKMDENLSSIIIGIVNLLATLISNVFIDKLGRKILLYISGTFMSISLFILGLYFNWKSEDNDLSHLGWLPLSCFIIFVSAFSIGAGPIPWLMLGEIFPVKIRGMAASATTAFNWTCTFIVTKNFKSITTGLGIHGAFWLFGINCAIMVAFVALFLPETKGQTLEMIELLLLRGPFTCHLAELEEMKRESEKSLDRLHDIQEGEEPEPPPSYKSQDSKGRNTPHSNTLSAQVHNGDIECGGGSDTAQSDFEEDISFEHHHGEQDGRAQVKNV